MAVAVVVESDAAAVVGSIAAAELDAVAAVVELDAAVVHAVVSDAELVPVADIGHGVAEGVGAAFVVLELRVMEISEAVQHAFAVEALLRFVADS
mmetsp:Transcript_1081/g.1472  ORF Transcript_1081/g.1472 Transcript_1081/m.1472 type:complete len:95 (-) Transcript_1081:1345-1629(-)